MQVWGLEVHQTCIYSKKTTFWCQECTTPAYTQKKSKNLIVKSHQTCIYSKKSKNQKLIHLCQSVPHRVWFFCFFFDFFEYMQVWWLLTIKCFDFFEYMQVWWLFPIKILIFLSICRFERLEVHQTCIYSKKINILMPNVHKTCIYSKKSKILIVKSHQTCIYSKKSKKSNTNSSMPVSPT